MRAVRVLAVSIALGALVSMPATAKRGMRAVLDAPVQLDKAPGKTLRVTWHLVDASAAASGPSRIYLRVSRCGHRPLIVDAKERSGGFSARFKVPKGGVRKLIVGLVGWQISGKRRHRADALFQFDPPLYRSCS